MAFDPSKIRARLASEKKWYSINNLAGGDADVMLYGEIGWLGTTADDFVRDVKQLQTGQINLHLSSPGGSVFDGIAIMNALKAHPANVTVYVDSLAASIASVIAMAGDRIVARQASEFMIHEASGLSVGNAADMREMAELLDRQSDKIAAIYAARAGGTVEEWRAAMAKETWFSAEEAVAAGLADEVDTGRRRGDEDTTGVKASWDLSVFRYAGREQAPAPEPVAKAKADSGLTFNIGDEIGAQLLALLREKQPAPEVRNVLRQFDEGDLVRVVGQPHEPGHSQGRVAVVNGNAYGIVFDTPDDDTEPGEPYLWYVDNELEFVAEGPDRAGEGYSETEPEQPSQAPAYGPASEPDEDDDTEELRPGVSHPMGRPIPTGATHTSIVATACPVHHTATEDRPWDAGPNERRLPSPMTVRTAKAMYAWYDDTQAADGELPKSACKLPHHEVSADGTPGAANLSGVRNALARLPQSDIPASQHDAVRRHLQAHLDDAKSADNHTDAWAELTAHLIQDDADNWSASVSHLTDTTASPSAAEA